jgi:hypothetical protein
MVTTMVEVRQRSADRLSSRSLGFFTDKSMGEQVVWACYRECWKVVHDISFTPDVWLDQSTKDDIKKMGYDTWAVNDYNSASSLFYIQQHRLWNQVPASLDRFQFTMIGSEM